MWRVQRPFEAGRFALDLIAAGALMLACSVVSAKLYQKIIAHAGSSTSFIHAIPLGTQRFIIQSGGRCVGEITTTTTPGTITKIEAGAELRVTAGGKLFTTTVSVSGFFNPLRQLTEGKVVLASEGLAGEAVISDVAPMRVKASGTLGGTGRTFDFSLPGPLSFERSSDGAFQLEYAAISTALSGNASAALVRSLAAELQLNAAADAANAPCHDRLDIEPLIKIFGPALLTRGVSGAASAPSVPPLPGDKR